MTIREMLEQIKDVDPEAQTVICAESASYGSIKKIEIDPPLTEAQCENPAGRHGLVAFIAEY